MHSMPKRLRYKKGIDYMIRVKNLGPAEATSVMVEMACTGLPYDVKQASPGCSITAGTTRCALGTLGPTVQVRLGIDIMPRRSGILTCTARVSSATADRNPFNQSKTVTTPVR
jgi:hypothetical protein